MPIYKPGNEVIQSNSALSGVEVDNDYSVTTILTPTISTRHELSIDLIINGSFKNTSVIDSNLTDNLTTLVVTIRTK